MAINATKGAGGFILLRDGFISTLLSLIVCYLLSLLFFNISFFDPVSKALRDFSFLDVYYAENLNRQNGVNPDIVLLNIEDNGRSEIALALEELLKANPKVVGFDVILKEFRATKEDSLLAQLLENDKIIGSVVLDATTNIANHPFFKLQNIPGYVNFNFDVENPVIRQFESSVQLHGTTYDSFSSIVAKSYLSKEKWEELDLDKKLKGSRVINYQGNLNHFIHFTLDDFMALEYKEIVANKIVLLGYLGTPTGSPFDVEDKHFTPLNKITAGKSIPDMYGMVVHANILSMILSNGFMYKVSNFWLLALTFICSFLASVYFIWLNKRLKLSYRTVRKAILLVFTIVLVWITLLLFKYGIVLKSAPIIGVTVFSAGFIKFYKHLVGWVNTKTNFRSYFK